MQNFLSSSLLPKNIHIKIYSTTTLPVVWYWCETWSLILREERRLGVFENRVLRNMFSPKRDEETGALGNQYYLGDQMKKNGMGGTCNTYGEEERCIQDFGGET